MEIKSLIEQFILSYGMISIFLIVALEYANIPLPSEIVLPFVGIMCFEYDMNIIIVIIVTVLGGVFGSILNYYLGYKFGKPLLKKIRDKYPKTRKSINASYKWIYKYEKISVMLSRVVPLARTFISLIAGVAKINIWDFVFFSTIGIAVWNITLISLGYFIGDNLHLIGAILSNYSSLILFILILGFIYFLIKKYIYNYSK